jgi:hypothetical protein
MFECLILGDSTGVGTARAINARYERHCDIQAAERATAVQILSWRRPGKRYDTCIFSMGSNDKAGPALAARLAEIRAQFCFNRVIWLLPYSRPQAYTVSSVAARFGDETLDLGRFHSRDGVHPSQYMDVAEALLR